MGRARNRSKRIRKGYDLAKAHKLQKMQIHPTPKSLPVGYINPFKFYKTRNGGWARIEHINPLNTSYPISGVAWSVDSKRETTATWTKTGHYMGPSASDKKQPEHTLDLLPCSVDEWHDLRVKTKGDQHV